jgi:hypothetical protein
MTLALHVANPNTAPRLVRALPRFPVTNQASVFSTNSAPFTMCAKIASFVSSHLRTFGLSRSSLSIPFSVSSAHWDKNTRGGGVSEANTPRAEVPVCRPRQEALPSESSSFGGKKVGHLHERLEISPAERPMSRRINTYKKSPCKPSAINTYKNARLKVEQNQHLQKNRGEGVRM